MITIELEEQEYVELCQCFEEYLEAKGNIMSEETLDKRVKILQKLMAGKSSTN